MCDGYIKRSQALRCYRRAHCEVIKLSSCLQSAPEVSPVPADAVYEGVEDLHGLLGFLEALPWKGDRQDGYRCMHSCSGPACVSETDQLQETLWSQIIDVHRSVSLSPQASRVVCKAVNTQFLPRVEQDAVEVARGIPVHSSLPRQWHLRLGLQHSQVLLHRPAVDALMWPSVLMLCCLQLSPSGDDVMIRGKGFS